MISSRQIVYKEEQINNLSERLNLTKTCVVNILNCYIGYILDRLSIGETVKFLNICYLKVGGKGVSDTRETLAYVANEIGYVVDVTPEVVLRVLISFEEYLLNDLRHGKDYCIKRIVRLKVDTLPDGRKKLRVCKSTIFNGMDITACALGSFRRKVENAR